MKIEVNFNETQILDFALKIINERIERGKDAIKSMQSGERHISGVTGEEMTIKDHEDFVKRWTAIQEPLAAAMDEWHKGRR